MQSRVLLSVVVPVFKCADCIIQLNDKITQVCTNHNISFEIIYVVDGSPDQSWSIICDIGRKSEVVRGILLSRNFGQHMAVTAGISESRGEKIIIMDCDLQDPPELIVEFLKASESYDVVLSRRISRSHTYFRKFGSFIYSKILRYLTGFELDADASSLTLFNRHVANQYLKFKDVNRHYLHILKWLGFKTYVYEYAKSERATGNSAYSVGMLIRHALQGVLFHSGRFLAWIMFMGFFASFMGFLLAAYYIVQYLWYTPPPGWTAIAVLITVMSGVILISVGVCGLYIGKIFEQVKGRPLYIIQDQFK